MHENKNRARLHLRKSMALDTLPHPCFIVDTAGHVVHANPAARHFFQADQAVLPAHHRIFLEAVANAASLSALVERALAGERIHLDLTLFIDERDHIGTLRIIPLRGRDNTDTTSLDSVIVSFKDQSQYIRLQRRLTRDEFFDTPTGLLNRKTLEIMLELELEKASRSPERASLATMMIHIRNLEHIRSLYSEGTINHIMEHLGNCIRTALRTNDLLFRYDENRIFAVLTNFKLKTDLLIIAERVEDQIAIPFHLQETAIHLQAAIGIAMFPEDGESGDALQGNAASALNQAMEDGKPWLMFNSEIHQRAMDRLHLRSGLSRAVKNNELELRYMTLVDADGVPRGLEALVRWNHPERGLLSPDVFLPVAIHSRIIGALTRWVLYRIVQDWTDHLSHYDLFITLNLSAIDFGDRYVVETLQSAINGRMPPERLKVEITESESLHNLDATLDVMRQLKALGIDVLIDDFGVGNSSLSYLRDLPARYAKVDRSFIANIATCEKEQEFIHHIIAMAAVRGIDILVEGIETAGQFDVLRHSGAKLFQGFHFGEAMTIHDIIRLMESRGSTIPEYRA